MKKPIKVASKKRGRPPSGGRDPGVHIRLPELMLAAIDAKAIEDGTNRSEAIRRLVDIGLKAKAKQIMRGFRLDRKMMELAERGVTVEIAAKSLGKSERAVRKKSRRAGNNDQR